MGGSMIREKMLFISNKIKVNHYLYFRLLNVLYKITFKNNVFSIQQFGVESIKQYETLKDLFENYIVYGNTLMEQIDDIKLCDDKV